MWAFELRCINIHVEVALIYRYLDQPKKWHLDQDLHIFSYLKHYSNYRIVFDSNIVAWYDIQFKRAGWTEFYGNTKDEIPQNAPEESGLPFRKNVFLGADHGVERMMCRLHKRIILLQNKDPVVWCDKWKNTVELSTFGSESVALRMTKEIIHSICYKLIIIEFL